VARVQQRIAAWKEELRQVEDGKVKFGNTWMSHEQKEWQVRIQNASTEVQGLKQKLDRLQKQRDLEEYYHRTDEARLRELESEYASLPDKKTILGFNGHVNVVANPEKAKVYQTLVSYRGRVKNRVSVIASLDAQMQDARTRQSAAQDQYKLVVNQWQEQLRSTSLTAARTTQTVIATAQMATPKPTITSDVQTNPTSELQKHSTPESWYQKPWSWLVGIAAIAAIYFVIK
jgi:DNA repair exonuclease SbcCD ATPase subunit